MCEDVRVALSARLDGEDPGQPAEAIDAHLASCPSCVAWEEDARRMTRAVRVQAASVPDLTEAIVAAAATAGRDREARGRRQILRVAVAAAAVVQVALALPALLGAAGDGMHASREMAAFDVAVAVGFLLAAYRPARARAYMPVALVLALGLVVTSGIDVARGETAVGHEFGHLVAVVQAALLYGLAAGGPRVREVAA
jgi:predicted anti-sigma-YlaC factor YlaD